MTEQERVIIRMQNILAEATSLDDEITYDNFYDKYCKAVDMLNITDGEESEDGELDLYKIIYNLGDEFFSLKSSLKTILEFNGLDTEQRKNFYKKHFTNY